MRRILARVLGAGALALALPAHAALEVVATTPSLGMLAREVGTGAVSVTVLSTPQQDVHQIQARPSIMARLRSADLLLAVGADLEAAWLAPAVRGAANPALLPSRRGYFEAAAHVSLLGAGKPADRRLGDVHPQGNPHLMMDPVRAGEVALALAERLAALDAANAPQYRSRARDLRARLRAAAPALLARVPSGVHVVLYHEDADYLMQRLGVPVLGYVEPLPGVPPTARHLAGLAAALEGRRGVVFHTPYQPASGPRRLAAQAGWTVAMLPVEPPADADLEAYLAHLRRWVDALAGGS